MFLLSCTWRRAGNQSSLALQEANHTRRVIVQATAVCVLTSVNHKSGFESRHFKTEKNKMSHFNV